MWKLTIEDDEGKQTGLPLAHDEYGLGRAEANSIRLTDRNVSRTHATLTKNAEGWLVRDLDSYNGTYVNGVRVVGEQHLRHGDLVQLGDYRIELVDESLMPQTASPAPSQGRGATLSPLHTRPNRLVMVVGPTPGAEFPLDGERFTIGRSEDASISINHSSVSRLHADLISLGGGRYEVVDRQSANGIRINGVELRRGLLEAGDALELGDVRLRFVGAGKIFRAGPDATNPSVAVSPHESITPSVRPRPIGTSSGSSTGKMVGVAVVLAVLAAGGIFALTRSGPTTPPRGVEPATTSVNVDADAVTLQKAQERLEAKDVEGAHKLLQSISETSPVREDPAFKEIEARWADEMFAEVEKAAAPSEKRAILNKIASTSSVDADRRTKAGDMIAAIDVIEPPPPVPGPGPGSGSRVGPSELPTSQPPGGGPTPPPGGAATSQPPTASTAAPSKTGEASPPPSPGSLDSSTYAAQRRQLEPRVWGGKASVEEIKMLRAICSHMGDRACRDRANVMLQQKQSAP